MKVMTINIPDDSTELVTELIEKLGGTITEKQLNKKIVSATGENNERVDHTYLFGKWKNFEIDAKKIRKELWRKA